MFSYNTPSGIVIMQSADTHQMFAYQYPGAYMNAPTAVYGAYTVAAPPHHHIQQQPQPLLQQSIQMHPQHMQSAAATLVDTTNQRMSRQMGPYPNRASRSSAAQVHASPMRRTRSGHVSKTRVAKRADLTKVCPSCTKQWRLCNCSNVKNRPAPKPYCKFVPPRMANKQNGGN